MTKEELAKKKGLKLNKEKQNPSDSLVTTKNSGEPETKTKTSPASKKGAAEKKTSAQKEMTVQEAENDTGLKRSPGKPKKRKGGDKKISFWLDEDLVNGLYGSLNYGDSVGDKINDSIRAYQKSTGTYMPEETD